MDKWSLCKKRLYKGLSINSCSVDVKAIKNTSSIQQIRSKIPATSAGLQQGTSPVVSFSRFFSKYLEHLRMFVIHFLIAMYQARIYFLCFFKKSDGLYFFPANWLLLIVIDQCIRQENSCGYWFRRFGKFPRQSRQWSSQ